MLRAAARTAPVELDVVEHALDDVPLYNFDVEQQGDPPGVARLKAAIAGADGVLVVTPEYQHGVPGVLKNALDWVSRPPGRSALQDKPAVVMGASPGMTGTARAQSQLRQVLTYNACRVLPPPEVLIARAAEKVHDGEFTDETSLEFITGAMSRFADWVAAYGPART
ncbi:MAG: hypothetical protein GEV08_21620 [Acidimicrobiia bacterium]|nr:hypothetical protein [Acidimicrobiia bacterium]